MSLQQSIHFDNSYAAKLEGFYVAWEGDQAPNPQIVQLNRPLAEELGLDPDDLDSPSGAAFLAGSELPDGANPLAQVYAGHQFGGFSQQLGDGRALLVGELIDRNGDRRDIHLKGSGRTPFSRGGDGKAVLGPVLREYLFGEAMHAMRVPTTRALAAVTTGEQVLREGGLFPGAVLARVASSHLRVGTFQFFAARGETEKLRQLADYAIARHYPDLANADDRYLRLLRSVIDVQASLVARWMSIGFVHGVMNTDNMTISGETIDYGPCAFLDQYDPQAVFSSIDHTGRYAYGNQPVIAQWNLARFAETLLPLIDAGDHDNAIRLATEEINAYPAIYQAYWLSHMRRKIGLDREQAEDLKLIDSLLQAMLGQNVDFTGFFRRLANSLRGDTETLRGMFDDPADLDRWLERWQTRLALEDESAGSRADAMDKVNPIYIPRNHKVEEALQSAVQDADLQPFKRLLDILQHPFAARDGFEDYASPAPESFGRHVTYCGT